MPLLSAEGGWCELDDGNDAVAEAGAQACEAGCPRDASDLGKGDEGFGKGGLVRHFLSGWYAFGLMIHCLVNFLERAVETAAWIESLES